IVVDHRSAKIVGVLSGVEKEGQAIAFAVPVRTLAEFVGRVQPFLAADLFPVEHRVSPSLADLYPKFVPRRSNQLERREQETNEVALLRNKAQLLADSMRNFVAVQMLAWGSGNKEPIAQGAYEVRVLDGSQKFRVYPDGKKDLSEQPFPNLNRLIVPGDEWSQLPQLVGKELRLKVQQAPDTV